MTHHKRKSRQETNDRGELKGERDRERERERETERQREGVLFEKHDYFMFLLPASPLTTKCGCVLATFPFQRG